MRHSVFGKKLSRTKNERRRLMMVLARQLIQRGRITTTLARAKVVQPVVEKLITNAKKARPPSLLQLHKILADKPSVQKLLEWAKTRFAVRTSGFTRVVKLGQRGGDAAEEALLEFVDPLPEITGKPEKITKTKTHQKPKQPKSRK